MKIISKVIAIAALLTITGCAATTPQGVAQTSGMGMGYPAGSIGTAAGMAGSVLGGAPASPIPALVSILIQQLGITPVQAMGGAGSIFSVAQQSMTPSNFGIVSKAVPGMETLLAAAPAANSTSLMGGAANALGGSSLGNMAALASSFQSLGMDSSMMGQFIPVVMQYVQGQGGSTAMSLMQSAIMP